MLRTELEHIIRAACSVAGQDQVLVVGSQAILGTYSEYELPEESTFSEEADVFPLFDNKDATISTRIDAFIGEMSPFHQQHGYYAQGVDRRTAILPEGWATRLVPIRNERTAYNTGWCLEVHDLCSAKLIANRDKDRAFVKALIDANLVNVATIRSRISQTRVEPVRQTIALTWVSRFPDNEQSYQAPELPHIPSNVPNHPASVIPEAGDSTSNAPRQQRNLFGSRHNTPDPGQPPPISPRL